MKTVCVYHSIDLDGWMSAGIVKYWWQTDQRDLQDFEIANGKLVDSTNDKLDFIGYNYGQPIPDLSEYDKVIMVDISFPLANMDLIASNVSIIQRDFIWIDHHFSAIKECSIEVDGEYISGYGGLRNTKYAACELTWKYFFPNETMPEIVRLLGRYDCFGHKGTDEEQKVLEFQFGARQEIWNYERAYMHLNAEIGGNVHGIESIKEQGKYIYQYLCTEAKQAYKNGFEIKFRCSIFLENNLIQHEYKLLKFICINKERFNPINFGIDYHKDGYDGCACFHYDGVAKLWRFSLYNDNGEVDCSQIAKQYGGGGHKGAAGFVVKNLNDILK